MALSETSLNRRIFFLMLTGMIALTGIVGFSLWLTYRTNSDADAVVHARQARMEASTLLILLQEMETSQRGYLLTHDRQYLAPYEAALPQILTTLDRLKARLADDRELSVPFGRLTGLIDNKLTELAETIDLASSGRYDDALAIVQSDRGKTVMDSLRIVLGNFLENSEARVHDRLAAMRATARTLAIVSISASLLIVLLAGVAIWTATRYTRELVKARREVELANASLEERVKERTADLTRANEEIQRFAYIVSHDLRAPLVNIVGFTGEMEAGLQSLQRFFTAGDNRMLDPALTEEARNATSIDLPEAIGFIRASTTKMDRLINAILKLSREGRRELHPEPANLGLLLGAGAASVQHQLGEKNARIEIADGLPVIVSDLLALEQIFGNLIDNAVKYLSPDRPGLITISAQSRMGTVAIEVADNGRGIAPADHERIFELFRRAGAQDVAGEGIGLAHVRALVRRLGGEITLESELGRGSRFKVVLPKNYGRFQTSLG